MKKCEAEEYTSWVNTTYKVKKDAVFPCKRLGYCPYGQLVEEFPLTPRRNKYSCPIFGHDCPIFYHYEAIVGPKTLEKLGNKGDINGKI